MRRTARVSLILIILISDFVFAFAGITTKIVKNPDGTLTRFFYKGNKEIAREIKNRTDKIIKTTGKIPDGVVREYYGSGKLKAEYNYKDGKPEGMSKFYYENGSLREEKNYKNGKLDGRYRNYYTTGSLGGEWYYQNGKREGMTKLYWENGNKKAERNFKSGKQEGVCKRYYNNGELRYIENFKNGIKINRKSYSKSGKMILEENYPTKVKGKK